MSLTLTDQGATSISKTWQKACIRSSNTTYANNKLTFHSQPILTQQFGSRSLLLIPARNHIALDALFQMLQFLRRMFNWSIRGRIPGWKYSRYRIFCKISDMPQVRDSFHLLIHCQMLEWRLTVNHLVQDTS